MKRILLVVAYDGTGYAGFQAQKSGVPTIEGELNRTLSELTKEPIEVIGASRTDAGVHALCNMAVFDTESRIPAEKFANALNVRLLGTRIVVQHSREVAPDFHPRHCDTVKTYEYRIYNAWYPSPIRERFTYFSYTNFDVAKMQLGAKHLIGTHDFKSFCSVHTQALTTVRTVTDVQVFEEPVAKEAAVWTDWCSQIPGPGKGFEPREIVIRVSGTGFLYNMVRIIAGTLMEVGRGALQPEDVLTILEATDRTAAGPTAPPEGLMLVKYEMVGEK